MTLQCCPELEGNGWPLYSCMEQLLDGGSHEKGPDLGRGDFGAMVNPTGQDS